MIRVGDRVGAIASREDGFVRFFGYGVYRGMFVPGPEARGFAEACHKAGRGNPKIELDNGEVVWGGECWWGPEDQIRAALKGHIVIDVLPSNERLLAEQP